MNRSLVASALGMSLATIAGCASLPLEALNPQGLGMQSKQQHASLRVSIQSGAFRTQGLEDLDLFLTLQLPGGPDGTPAPQVREVTSGQVVTFDNLMPGHVELTLEAKNRTSGQVVETQKRGVDLRMGTPTEVAFHLVIGGTSALDLGMSFSEEQISLREFHADDDADMDFKYYSYPYEPVHYQFVQGDATHSIAFSFNEVELIRRVGTGPEERFARTMWEMIPDHATYVETVTLGTYPKVRHFRWENTYRMPVATESVDKVLTFDRWYSPTAGLLKETVSEGENVISTLSREER